MEMKRTSVIAAALFLVIALQTAVHASLDFSPAMELLGGVLSQTTWIENRGPQGEGNEYFRALQAFFSEFKGHKAVTIAQELTKNGFAYDAPPAFICHLGPLPDLELVYECSDYLVQRAGGRDKLEEFRLALRDLAQESNFLGFYAQWEPYLNACLEPAREGFRSALLIDWLQDFFGWSASEFQLIVTASMFPAGGYGATVTGRDGSTIAFQIIREYGRSSAKPEFPTSTSLELLTIHELGHSFVNPCNEQYPERTKRLKPLYWPVRKEMRQQAYPSVDIFLNEQVLRGVEVIAAQDLYEPGTAEAVIASNENNGFYLTRFVAEQLEHYRANRETYPTFRDFMPYLYDQLETYQKENSSWSDRFFSMFLR